jgi:hypothetical protein
MDKKALMIGGPHHRKIMYVKAGQYEVKFPQPASLFKAVSGKKLKEPQPLICDNYHHYPFSFSNELKIGHLYFHESIDPMLWLYSLVLDYVHV